MDARPCLRYLRRVAVRIAFVTPYLPSPANTGGRIRMYRLAQGLARHGARVSLFACAAPDEVSTGRARDELQLYDGVWARPSDLGCVVPWAAPRRVRRSCPWRLRRDLSRAHAARAFDLVVCAHSYALATVPRDAAVPVVLDEHNIESVYARSYGSASGAVDLRQVALLEAWERGAWRRASLVTCVSRTDAEAIAPHRRGPLEVVANGANVGEIEFRAPSQRTSREVLFVGLMSHAPNVAAARFLAHEVMPRVWRVRPDARLVLCGRAPSRDVLALAGPRVRVTGTVSSVHPYLARAGVYANALFHGAGTSLKVPEALASGVPLVSSELGVRGFSLANRAHYIAAEQPDEFARAISAALGPRHEPEADARAERGRIWAETLDWTHLGAHFARLVERAAGAAGSARA